MPPGLELRDAVTAITGIVTLSGIIWALRAAVSKLELGQTELLRQVGAIHKRMDDYGKRIQKAELDHAVLTERVNHLRESQRFTMRAASSEAPMFKDDAE